MGEYCSYCEVRLSASLAVEHVQPKDHRPDRALDWGNFLLACTNCNSTKGATPIQLSDYFWPDQDNTFRAIAYREGGRVRTAADLSHDEKAKADGTIQLTGLDKEPRNDPEMKDRRWQNRRECWDVAQRMREKLSRNNNDDFREVIVSNAAGRGFWGVWMTVFRNDPDMRNRLIRAFPGTATNSFDAQGGPVPRPGGQI